MNILTNHSAEWWKSATIYQIYPKSFQDSAAKGSGDIKGIHSRLAYLKQLGVDAIWITPIYYSPQVDNGYDISDYYAINPDYGTMADFEALIAQAHKLGMRIMMDMVFNHTSTQHAWFQSSLDKNSPYRDFYIWREGKAVGVPPNGWQSKFGGSAWQWHEASQQYYLHLFAVEQADLNWENSAVREALKSVCRFWAEKGVDALRLDVINLVSKQQDFPDDSTGDGRRFYTDGPRIHEFLQEFSHDVFQPYPLITVGEMSSTSLSHCQQYAALDGSELSMTFNFHHLKVDYPDGKKWTTAPADFVELKQIMAYWQQGMHGKAWNALFWCNHDQPRVVSRFGNDVHYHKESAKMLAMALYGLQGTPYIYQGEEIGMCNPYFQSISNYRDIESLNYYHTGIEQGSTNETLLAVLAARSRDNSRTPMQWDSSSHAGFSRVEPWISIANNFTKINVANALADPNSIFYCYQALIKLRKEQPIFIEGSYLDLDPSHPNLWCYQRCFQQQTLLVICNLSEDSLSWQLPSSLQKLQGKLLFSNLARSDLPTERLTLAPYEALYLLYDITHD